MCGAYKIGARELQGADSSLKTEKEKRVGAHYKLLFKSVAVLIVLGLSVMIGTIVLSLGAMRQTINDEVEKYITELSHGIEDTVNLKFQRALAVLESVAIGWSYEEPSSAVEMASLQQQAEWLHYEYLAFVSQDGNAACSDGVSRQFPADDPVMSAFGGEPVVGVPNSAQASSDDGLSPLYFAVPVYAGGSEGEVTGVLAACSFDDWAKELMTQYYCGGSVFFNVIRTDGSEVLMADTPYITKVQQREDFYSTGNLFDALRANAEILSDVTVEDIAAAASVGSEEVIKFRFRQDGNVRSARIISLDNSDLCLWLVVMENTINENFSILLNRVLYIDGLLIVGTIILAVILLFFYQKSMRLVLLDPITGGYSVSRFDKEAEGMIKASQAGDYLFISLDITGFKMLNDSYGYQESDRLLKYVHDTIFKYLGYGELMTRSRADDFNVLLRSRSDEQLLDEMDQVARDINSFNEGLTEKQWITFQVGVYRVMDTSIPIVGIRDRANMARKRPKKDNSHTLYAFGFYEEGDRLKLKRENRMRNRMRDALADHEFLVYLQPKVEIQGQNIVGAEALVRWMDKDEGLISPEEFIPLFEQIGFIRQLDLYVFEQVCILLRRWMDAGVKPVPISVNLSRIHLRDRKFLDPFVKLQKRYAVPPKLIEIELTETAFQDYPEAVASAVGQIHAAGFLCSLDDFGSGYSSFNSLETLAVDILKLDRQFLSNVHAPDDKGCIIIEELVHMANRLGLCVCCEGVETAEQLNFLRSCHCEIGQGYLFSKPVEISEFEKMFYGSRPSDAQSQPEVD